MSKEVKTSFDKYQDKSQRKAKPITLSVIGDNDYLLEQAYVECAVDDFNLLCEAFAEQLTNGITMDSDMYLEPYRSTLKCLVDNYDGIVTDDIIDSLRTEARQILCHIAEGLQETHEWFMYTYRLVETINRDSGRTNEYLITLKKDRRILSMDIDTEDVERKFSRLINRLLQLT